MRKHLLVALIPIVLWSTAFMGVKIGLEYASPYFFAGTRFMLSGILLMVLLRDPVGIVRHAIEHWKIVLATAMLQTFIFYFLYYTGIGRVPASIAAIVIGSIPLMSAVTAHMFIKNDVLTVRKVISLLIAVGGLVIISLSRDPATKAGMREVVGILMLVLACAMEAILQVLLKTYKKRYDPMKLNSAQIFIGGLLLFLLSLAVEGVPTFRLPSEFYISLVWLSIVSAAAFSIWYHLIQKPDTKVSELNMIKFLNPIFGATLSWVFLRNDSPDLYSLVGMAVISFSVLMFYYKPKNR